MANTDHDLTTISLKIKKSILKEIDDNLDFYNFSTRTEFVRQAIRDKVEQLETKKFEAELRQFFRKNKLNVGDREFQKAHKDIFEELEHRFGHKKP